MVFAALAAWQLAAVPIPKECQPPEARDVAGLTRLAQRLGELSVGLDSVATWCFDAAGAWTGGAKPTKRDAGVNSNSAPVGDCARAVGTCEGAKVALAAEPRQLLADALQDLEQPFLGRRYTPKRSGLGEKPSEVSECSSKSRGDLFAQAQARMDLARLTSVAQNEYRNFRTWLYAESLSCAQAVARRTKDPLRKGIAVDGPVGAPDTRPQKLPAGPPAVSAHPQPPAPERSAPVTGEATTGVASGTPPPRDAAFGGSGPTATPRPGLSSTKSDAGNDPVTRVEAASTPSSSRLPGAGSSSTAPAGATLSGSISGISVSSTATGVNAAPELLPNRLVASAGSEGRASPTPDRAALLEKWRKFVARRAECELDRDYTLGFLASRELRDCRCPRLHPSEVVKRLEAADTLSAFLLEEERHAGCEQCLLDAFVSWRGRADKQCALMDKLSEFELGVLERSDDGNGLPPRCFQSARARRPDAGLPLAAAQTPDASLPSLAVVARPTTTVSSAIADSFVKAEDYAPIPMREDGRLYVRIFMSSACVADVRPGPMQARTGDLVLIPWGEKALSVKSPCGGLAEVYWGREPRPRVSEIFGRNQALQLQFKPQ